MLGVISRERVFRKSGPDAVAKLEEEVNRWMKDMDDWVEVEDLREFEDENENGKFVAVVIAYHYLTAPS